MNLTADDIRGVVGIVPTPATSDAERWDAVQTINLVETEKMIRAVVEAGIDILMTTGTFGECATLTWPELQTFVDCVVQTTAGRRPVFAGVTTLNTRDTIERGRRLVEIGADALVVYDNPFAFKGKISSAVYAQLAKIPEIVAAKHVGGPALESDMRTVGNDLRIL